MNNKVTIIGDSVANMPWEKKPEGHDEVLWRSKQNPIIERDPIPCADRIFNSAVIPYKGEFIGVFRADYKNTKPHLHLGRSKDGIDWDINPEKIQWVDEDGNLVNPSYAYDPRVVKIEDTYYITWCTEFNGPTIGVGKTKNFETFNRLENAFVPFNRNGVLFPRKIDDKYVMLNRPSDNGHTPFGDIFLSQSPNMCHWGEHRYVMGSSDENWWENTKIGPGPVPIETSEGWLIFYHGVTETCNGFVYSIGAALLDLDDPSKVLARTNDYLLTPQEEYETTGFVPNVAFPCATLHDAKTGQIAIYYGAADTYVAVAYTQVEELITHLKDNS
ncbi:glycoside hydrolase family 130 protein [Halanaerocella petrolearia]